MVIIIPGWMHSATIWNQVSDSLRAADIEHYVLDIPGFGTVPADESLQTFEDLVNWCQREITRVSTGKPYTLVGHSCGGRVAVELAKRDATSIKKMILTGSPNLYRPSFRVKVIKLLTSVLGPVKSLIPMSVRKKARSDDYTEAKDGPMANLYQSVYKSDQTETTSSIHVQTLLIWGEHDTAAPIRIAKELEKIMKYVSLDIIKGVGHNIHIEKPQLLAAKIVTFEHEGD